MVMAQNYIKKGCPFRGSPRENGLKVK